MCIYTHTWTQVYPCTLDFANGDSSFLRKYRDSRCSTIDIGIVTHNIIHSKCMPWYLCKQDAGKRHLTTSTFGTCYEDQVFFWAPNTYRISHKTCLLPNFRLLQEPGHLVLCVSSMPKFGSRGRHVVTFPGTSTLILKLSGRCYGHAENRSWNWNKKGHLSNVSLWYFCV